MTDKILDFLGFDKASIKSILTLHHLDKSLIPFCILQLVLSAILPFVELYFVSRIIDAVLLSNTPSLLFLIVSLIIANLLLGVLLDVVKNINHYKATEMQKKMISLIQQKVMQIDFELMEDTQMLKKISDAKYAMEHMGGYYAYITRYRELLEAWTRAITSVAVIVEMCAATATSDSSLIAFMASPAVSITLLAGLAVANVFFSQYISKKSKISSAEVFKQKAIVERKLNYFTNNIFLNFSTGKDIRIFNMAKLLLGCHKKYMHEAYDFYNTYYVKKELNFGTLSILGDSVLTFVAYLVVIFKVLAKSITIGEFSGYIGVITLFNAALTTIISTHQKITLQKEYTQTFGELLDMETNLSSSNRKTVLQKAITAMEFEFHNVSFRYRNSEEYTLKNVSCKLQSGKKTAIVGRNGAGKTTFIKLLCRLYEPTDGFITLNGVDIKEYDYNQYVSLISAVFQDYSLFALPLHENVSVSQTPNREKVLECLEMAGVADRVNKMPNGIETNLYRYDEDGVEISGGEAQKIAIARALYKDAPVIILDEPTASLDPISEYEVYKTISELTENKTIVYISHRMHSCRFCDEIIVIDGGEIIQKGNHNELYSEDEKLYAILYKAQEEHYK